MAQPEILQWFTTDALSCPAHQWPVVAIDILMWTATACAVLLMGAVVVAITVLIIGIIIDIGKSW